MRIVIVGGVAAGMSAAARARRLTEGAHIVVLERGEHVSFANCGLPYYVGGEINDPASLLVQTPKSLAASLNLDVRVRHNVTAIDARAKTVHVESDGTHEDIGYDALILAPGAVAARPPIAGMEDSVRVRTLRTVDDALALRESAENGSRHAVVLGAGFIGIEAAEALALQGLNTSIVEYAEHVLPPLEQEMASLVTEELGRLGVVVHERLAARRIVPEELSDTVILSDGTQLQADIIVLSTGVRPDTAAFEDSGVECERGAIVVDEYGRTSLPDVYAAGDATVSTDAVTGIRRPVALAGPANRAGRQIADAIVRPDSARPIPAPMGTAIVRVGGLTAAMTGANRASLRQAGIRFHTLHLHPGQHAGYFPGAEQIHLIVHIRRSDGMVLGAQAVGKDGVDKRIDVLATAIRNHMGVSDLIDLDLAYAPPYGSAKDPINMVGMVGSNVMDGLLPLWYAEEWKDWRERALVLDVRSMTEFSTGHLPGALNIPHTQLRERMEEVRIASNGRPVRVLCQSGVRSHIANRILANAGFDTASLSGGMLTVRAMLGTDVLEYGEQDTNLTFSTSGVR
ncbi:FAD-dependent oxidoreductase [Actinomycetaceae bacterium L2_0104]